MSEPAACFTHLYSLGKLALKKQVRHRLEEFRVFSAYDRAIFESRKTKLAAVAAVLIIDFRKCMGFSF